MNKLRTRNLYILTKSVFCFALLFLSHYKASAYKGAYIRVFNLTNETISCEAKEVTRFDNENNIKNALKGQLNPFAAFPANAPLYIEERTMVRDADLILQFNSSAGNPSIQITYRSSFYIHKKSNNGDLYIYGLVTDSKRSGSQYLITIYISKYNVSLDNWMSQIADSVKLSDLLMTGSHDAGTYRWNTVTPLVKTQTLSITEQLENGARYFDLRGRADNKYVSTGRALIPKDLQKCDIQVTHGNMTVGRITLTFEEVFEQLYAFLRAHPQESAMLQIKMDHTDEDVFKNSSDVEDVIKCMVNKNPGFFYTGDTIPRLGDTRGKIVLINRVHGSKFGFDIAGWQDNAAKYSIQDKFENISPEEKLKAITGFLETKGIEQNKLNLNFVSYTYKNIVEPLNLARGTDPVYQKIPIPLKIPYDEYTRRAFQEGMNYDVSKYLLNLAKVPSFHSVFLVDGLSENDALSWAAVLLNFTQYGKQPQLVPIESTARYFIHPKAAIDKVLNIDVSIKSDQKKAVIYHPHPSNDPWPWQQFVFEAVQGKPNIYRIKCTDVNKSLSLFIDAYKGNTSDEVVGYKDCSNGTCSLEHQYWKIEQYGNTPYYTITSVIDNKRLDLIAGNTADNAVVKRYPAGGSVNNQLWFIEKVK